MAVCFRTVWTGECTLRWSVISKWSTIINDLLILQLMEHLLRWLAFTVFKTLFLYYHFHERYRQDLHETGKCAEGLWQYAIKLDPCLVVHTLACVANRQWHPATPFGDNAVTWALPIPLLGLMGDCFIYLFLVKIFKQSNEHETQQMCRDKPISLNKGVLSD